MAILLTGQGKAVALSVAVIGLFGLGTVTGWKLAKKAPQTQTAKAEPGENLANGAVLLPVVAQDEVKPTTPLPAGDRVRATGTVTLSPSKEVTVPTFGPSPKAESLPGVPALNTKPIELNYTLAEEPNGNERVIIQAPGWTVAGTEIEVPEPVIPKKEIIPLVGYQFNTSQVRYGLMYRYQAFRHVSINAGLIGNIGFAGVGISW